MKIKRGAVVGTRSVFSSEGYESDREDLSTFNLALVRFFNQEQMLGHEAATNRDHHASSRS